MKITLVKGKRVVFAGEAPLEAGWVQGGIVFEKAHVSQVISMVLAQNSIRDKDVTASVSGMQSIYRVVYIPKLNRALMAEAARKEMARAIPVPLSSLYTSWTDVKISDNEIALCLLGIPLENVNSVVDTLKLSGLRIQYLELRPLAVSRVIDEKSAIVVNVRPNTFDITIMNNGIPEMIRSLPFGGAPVMSEGDKVRMVKEEVEKTVNFFNSGHPEGALGTNTYCIVSGILRETLSMIMGYPVKAAPPLLSYPPGHDSNDYIVNTGLALRTINRLTRVDINVIPKAAPAEKAGGAVGNRLPLIVLLVCAVLALGTWLLSGMTVKRTAEMQLALNAKSAQLNSLQKQYRDMTVEATKTRDTYQQMLNRLNAPIKYLTEQRSMINRDVGEVFAVLPATIYLTSIVDDGNLVRIQGSAPSEEIMLNYVRALRNSGRFKLVMISSVGASSFTEVLFALQLNVNQ
ncbi:MAG: PilN domain-containing protein [Dehalococcoidia bacterium]